jgi:hypothetical protein
MVNGRIGRIFVGRVSKRFGEVQGMLNAFFLGPESQSEKSYRN